MTCKQTSQPRSSAGTDRLLKPLLLSLGLALLTPLSAPAQDEMCPPALGGLAGTPTLDGNVDGDNGWAAATQFNLIDPTATGGTSRDVVLRVGQTSTHLYLGLIIDEPQVHQDDVLVIGLSTDTNDAHDWRLHIKPFDTALPSVGTNNLSPHTVDYWRDSTIWNTAGATANPAPLATWPSANTRIQRTTSSRWEIEIRIPREGNIANAGSNNAVYFPASGSFELYVDAISTTFLGTYTEAPWPQGSGVVPAPSLLLNESTPPKTQWGTASFGSLPGCDGVRLTWDHIGTRNPTVHQILLNPDAFNAAKCADPGQNWTNPTNTFFSEPENTTTADADDVFVTYKIANWGIPSASQWSQIGPAGTLSGNTNPTSPATVPAAGFPPSTTFEVGWAPTKQQSCDYANHTHQCILVEMDSTNPSVRFLNRAVTRNMDFVHASTFQRDAEVSAIGYGPPPAGQTAQEFLLFVVSDTERYERVGDRFVPFPQGAKPPSPNMDEGTADTAYYGRRARGPVLPVPARLFPNAIREAMTWTVLAYRKTAQGLIIDGTRYTKAEPVGGFGYVAGHDGAVSRWVQRFEGAKLERLSEDVYLLRIEPGHVETVTTTIQAIETGPWSLSVHAGQNDPQGDRWDACDGDLSWGVDLEYLFGDRWAAELFYGHEDFNCPGGHKDTVDHLSLNGKAYLLSGFWRPFVGVGIGGYDFSPGPTELGGNVFVGLQANPLPNLGVEATARYHKVQVSSTDADFLTYHVGLRFRF